MGVPAHIENGNSKRISCDKRNKMKNSLKDRIHFLTAVLLLLLIGFTVWYVLFYTQGPEIGSDGTLVYHEIGKLVAA